MKVCEGGAFSEEKAPPSRSLPQRRRKGRRWGRGRFSERSASPPDPLSRRANGVWLVRFCLLSSACECGRSPINLVVVTAADRAAATLRRGGTNPSARFAGTSPFRGGFLRVPKLTGLNVRSTSFPAASSLPQAQALVENGTFSTGPLVRNRRDTVWGAPARLHRHKIFV